MFHYIHFKDVSPITGLDVVFAAYGCFLISGKSLLVPSPLSDVSTGFAVSQTNSLEFLGFLLLIRDTRTRATLIKDNI